MDLDALVGGRVSVPKEQVGGGVGFLWEERAG